MAIEESTIEKKRNRNVLEGWKKRSNKRKENSKKRVARRHAKQAAIPELDKLRRFTFMMQEVKWLLIFGAISISVALVITVAFYVTGNGFRGKE